MPKDKVRPKKVHFDEDPMGRFLNADNHRYAAVEDEAAERERGVTIDIAL